MNNEPRIATPAQQFALLFLDPALPQPTVSLMSLHNKLLKNHTGSNAISSFICQPTITADEVDSGLQGQAHLRVVL